MANQTKLKTGYRMPAEWEPHEATWLAWPHNQNDWPGKFEPIPLIYAEIVRHLTQVEKVHILVNDAAAAKSAKRVLKDAGALRDSVIFHQVPTDRVWTRDSGPIFVRDRKGKLVITNWKFNAWAKYKNWHHDDLVPDHAAEYLGMEDVAPALITNGKVQRIVLEGGAIDVNGRGTLLTTEECLLSKVQQRNPGISREEYEWIFEHYLGITNVIWLGKGIVGDDTHGHIDDLTRFIAPRCVVTMVETDRRSPNHKPLADNLKRLRAAKDQDGKPLEVVEIPLPAPVMYQGNPLPASYANFYIANKLVLVPIFGDKHDGIALDLLQQLFPTRDIVPVYCRDFIWGFGAIHCMTQQQPAR